MPTKTCGTLVESSFCQTCDISPDATSVGPEMLQVKVLDYSAIECVSQSQACRSVATYTVQHHRTGVLLNELQTATRHFCFLILLRGRHNIHEAPMMPPLTFRAADHSDHRPVYAAFAPSVLLERSFIFFLFWTCRTCLTFRLDVACD